MVEYAPVHVLQIHGRLKVKRFVQAAFPFELALPKRIKSRHLAVVGLIRIAGILWIISVDIGIRKACRR